MKRIVMIAAALFMVVAVSAPASAEMVNAGLIEMNKADFESLRDLVAGSKAFDARSAAAPKKAAVDSGLVKLSAADLAAIEDYVAGRSEFVADSGKVSGEKMVNAGLIDLPEADLVDMERMVQKGHAERLAMFSSMLPN